MQHINSLDDQATLSFVNVVIIGRYDSLIKSVKRHLSNFRLADLAKSTWITQIGTVYGDESHNCKVCLADFEVRNK